MATQVKADVAGCRHSVVYGPEDGRDYWDVLDPDGDVVDSWLTRAEALADARERTLEALEEERERLEAEAEEEREAEEEAEAEALREDLRDRLDRLTLDDLRALAARL